MKPITRTEQPATLYEVRPTELALVHGGAMPPADGRDWRPQPLKPVGPIDPIPDSPYRTSRLY